MFDSRKWTILDEETAKGFEFSERLYDLTVRTKHIMSSARNRHKKCHILLGLRNLQIFDIAIRAEELGTHHPSCLPNLSFKKSMLSNQVILSGQAGQCYLCISKNLHWTMQSWLPIYQSIGSWHWTEKKFVTLNLRTRRNRKFQRKLGRWSSYHQGTNKRL